MGKDFEYVENPLQHIKDTKSLSELEDPMKAELKETQQKDEQLSKEKSEEVKKAEPRGTAQWSDYDQSEK